MERLELKTEKSKDREAKIKRQQPQVLFLGGIFADENVQEIIRHAKGSVEFSANQMQKKLIDGFRQVANVQVLSAPFIGSYPNRSSIFYFSGFHEQQNICEYVSFCNLWGFRNVSRGAALKKKIRRFAAASDEKKMILVFSAHEPFLSAAVYAKKIDPAIKICFFVPDLPQYMNLDSHRSKIYDFCKKADIRMMQRLIRKVDTSVLLTKPMAEKLSLADRPYMVVEGVINSAEKPTYKQRGKQNRKKNFVNVLYAGKLNEKFGIKNLLDGFSKIPAADFRLTIAGNGDMVSYIQAMKQNDSRIRFLGQQTPKQVEDAICEADILINPRENTEEYTKYSFPSKNIEYLMSGKPVVAYMLDGIPEYYRDFIFEINPDCRADAAIRDIIQKIAFMDQEEIEKRTSRFRQYAVEHLSAERIAQRILQMNFDEKLGSENGKN